MNACRTNALPPRNARRAPTIAPAILHAAIAAPTYQSTSPCAAKYESAAAFVATLTARSRRTGVQEVVTVAAHEDEDQQTARTRAEEAVVQPDRCDQHRADEMMRAGKRARRMLAAEILAPQHIDEDREQHDRHERAKDVGA